MAAAAPASAIEKALRLMSLILTPSCGEVPISGRRLDQESFHIVVRQLVVNTRLNQHNGWWRIAVQLGQQVSRRLVTSFDQCRRITFDKKLLAEVLNHQQSGFAVGSEDIAGAEKPRPRRAWAIAMKGVTFSARCAIAL